jgi:hypothetical protein
MVPIRTSRRPENSTKKHPKPATRKLKKRLKKRSGVCSNVEDAITLSIGRWVQKIRCHFAKYLEQLFANWEGVHGETNSTIAAGVAGIQLNPNGTGAGVYAESRGKGPAGFFKGDVQVTGDVILTNQDCAEDFDIGLCTNAETGTVMVLDEGGLLRVQDDPREVPRSA